MQLRPSYQYQSSRDAEDVTERLREALHEQNAPCRGRVREGRVELIVNDEKPHFWAPELRARIYEEGERAVIRGHFAPKPDTWTMFLAIYAATIFSTGVGTVFGLAQWQLGSSPWALWTLPLGLAGVCGVWLAARMGQTLGADNMATLQRFIEDTLRGDED